MKSKANPKITASQSYDILRARSAGYSSKSHGHY